MSWKDKWELIKPERASAKSMTSNRQDMKWNSLKLQGSFAIPPLFLSISLPFSYTSPIQYFKRCNGHISHPPPTCNALLNLHESACALPPVTRPSGGHINGATVQVSCYRMIVVTVQQEERPLCDLFLSLTFGPSSWQRCHAVPHLSRHLRYLCIFKVTREVMKVFLSNPSFLFGSFPLLLLLPFKAVGSLILLLILYELLLLCYLTGFLLYCVIP